MNASNGSKEKMRDYELNAFEKLGLSSIPFLAS